MEPSGPDDWLPVAAPEELSLFWDVCASHFKPAITEFRNVVRLRSELQRAHSSAPEEQTSEDELRLERGIDSDLRLLENTFAEIGVRWSRAGVDLSQWYTLSGLFQKRMLKLLISRYLSEPDKLELAICGLNRFSERATRVITREYLREREQLLSEQRERTEKAVLRYMRLSESGIIGILICGFDGTAKEANDEFLRIVGYTRADLGQLNWIAMTPPEWHPQDHEALRQLAQHGRSRPWEKEYFRKDGTRVAVMLGVAKLDADDAVSFVLDISERKRLEELRQRSHELEQQNARMREATRLKSEFLANMSHELRTPLNSIIGFADLLNDGEVTTESPHYREFLGDILKSGRHLLQLINDVLDLAKVESGKMEIRPEPVELNELVGEVCAVLRSLLSQKNLELDCEVDPNVNHATLDPARLKQILYNYISNAIKFTAPGGKVQVRVRPDEPLMLRLEVTDDGIGISERDQARLFVEFQQLDQGSGKREPGTGLGLALTKRIVEAMGGQVGVRSKMGEGSTFFATLPCHHRIVQSPIAVSPRVQQAEATVLIIEDDPRDQQQIAEALESVGYAVEVAATADEALERCRTKQYDAITLDLILPDEGGVALLHQLRTSGLNRRTPVVVVSVLADSGKVGGFAVHDWLLKPLRGGELVTALAQAGVRPRASGAVLLVDDDPSSRRLMEISLLNLGFRVQCCENGAAALRIAQQKRPLAVILDLLMPKVDGFAFLARFRQRPENRGIPVIVWTVHDLSPADRRRLTKLAQGVFIKGGGRPAALLEELQHLLATPPNTRVRSVVPSYPEDLPLRQALRGE